MSPGAASAGGHGIQRGAIIVPAQTGQLTQGREERVSAARCVWPPTLAGRDHWRLRRS